jgi:LPS sulfotransferase NodH
LCDGLAATGLAGDPREWFNEFEQRRRREQWGLLGSQEPGCYLRRVLAAATTANGICGVKLHYYQLAGLYENLGSPAMPPDPAALEAAFPGARYLWLRRRDKARQALSYARASQTQVWWRIGRPSPAGPKGHFRYDPDQIYELERQLTANEEAWWQFIARAHTEPLILDYEDLTADYVGTVREVLRWLELPQAATVTIAPPRLQRQASAHDEQWLRRYLRHKALERTVLERTAAGRQQDVPDTRWLDGSTALDRDGV